MYKSWMWKQRSYREQFQDDQSGGAGGGAQAEADGADQGDGDGDGNQGAAEGDDADRQNGEQTDGAAAEDDGEVVVMLGDEPIPASTEDEIDGKPAPAWIKELRKQNREKDKRIRELEQAQQASQQQTSPAAQALGPKPTPEDFDFDAEKYGDALVEWNGKKAAIDAQQAAARAEQEAADAAWKARLKSFETAKAALKVPDFDDAQHVVDESLNLTQRGLIIQGADKPELLVYAIGKNPAKAKELAAIKDPVKFAFAVAKLETQLKVAPRANVPPAPERQVRGTTGGGTSIDSTEARLEAEADRSGDRSKLIAYRREKRRQKAA